MPNALIIPGFTYSEEIFYDVDRSDFSTGMVLGSVRIVDNPTLKKYRLIFDPISETEKHLLEAEYKSRHANVKKFGYTPIDAASPPVEVQVRFVPDSFVSRMIGGSRYIVSFELEEDGFTF